MGLIEDGEHFMTMPIKGMGYNLSRMLEVLENFLKTLETGKLKIEIRSKYNVKNKFW